MRIFFLTREPDVCQLLGDRLSGTNTDIRIFPIVTKLFQTIFDFHILPDILFLDFLYFQNDSIDFYGFLKKKNSLFPVVFYNHPFPLPERRKFFWEFNLKKTGFFKDISHLLPILSIMEKSLQDPVIYPYVSGIQSAKPYRSTNLRYIQNITDPKEIEFYTERFDNVITDSLKGPETQTSSLKNSIVIENSRDNLFTAEFRSRNRLSHKIYTLFSYLYAHRNCHVSIEELSNVLCKGMHQESNNGIRLAVYRLRAILKKDELTDMEILNYDYGYSLIEHFENKTE